MTKFFKSISLAIAMIIIAGCATLDSLLKPSAENLIVAADFLPEKYYQGKFMVLPTTSSVEKVALHLTDHRTLTDQMASYAGKVRPGLSFASYEETIKNVGVEESQEIAEQFLTDPILSPEAVSKLSNGGLVKYAIFPQIVESRVKEDWSESRDDDHYDVTVTSNQTVYVHYTVVDLDDNRNVWSARIKGTDYAFESYERYRSSRRNYGDAAGPLAVLDVLLGEDPRERYKEEKDERSYEERFPAPANQSMPVIVFDINKGFIQNLEKLKQ